MAQFVFTGDPRHPGEDPPACVMWGNTFVLNGSPVNVTDAGHIERLSRNTHFKRVDGAAQAAPSIAQAKSEDALENLEDDQTHAPTPKKRGRPKKSER